MEHHDDLLAFLTSLPQTSVELKVYLQREVTTGEGSVVNNKVSGSKGKRARSHL